MTDESKRSDATSRRDFLKASTAGAVALTGRSIARSAHAAGSQTIRIGMIGCGGRCAGAAGQAMKAGPDVKLVAMCDIFENRLQSRREALKKLFGDQVAVDDDHCFVGFDGYQKLIDTVDVVLIACAAKFFPMHTEAAVKAGKHVFVEKPHAIDPVGVRRIQAAADLAKEKGISIVSGLQWRFDAGLQEAVKRIRDGAIGDVVAAQCNFLRGPYGLVPRDPNLTEIQYQFSNWKHFFWLSGDDVCQSLVHNLDRVSWVLKEEMPSRAFGLGGRSASFGDVYGDMFDHHTVVYEYDSGAQVYALCRTQKACYGNRHDTIMGTKGTFRFRGVRGCKIEGETNWQYRGPRRSPSEAEQKALIDSVRDGRPINSGYHMANSTMVAILGQLACYSGKAITWDEAYQSNLRFGPPPEESTFDTEPPTLPDETGNYPLPIPGLTKVLG